VGDEDEHVIRAHKAPMAAHDCHDTNNIILRVALLSVHDDSIQLQRRFTFRPIASVHDGISFFKITPLTAPEIGAKTFDGRPRHIMARGFVVG